MVPDISKPDRQIEEIYKTINSIEEKLAVVLFYENEEAVAYGSEKTSKPQSQLDSQLSNVNYRLANLLRRIDL